MTIQNQRKIIAWVFAALILMLAIGLITSSCLKSNFPPPVKCAHVVMVSTRYREDISPKSITVISVATTNLGTICGKDLDAILSAQHQHAVLCEDGSLNNIDYIITLLS